jgi:hypothetical protein
VESYCVTPFRKIYAEVYRNAWLKTWVEVTSPNSWIPFVQMNQWITGGLTDSTNDSIRLI